MNALSDGERPLPKLLLPLLELTLWLEVRTL